MIISDEEKGHVIIGEAAVNLIFNREEISLETLLNELKVMAENEPSDERVIAISAARNWLKTFRQQQAESTLWSAPMQRANHVLFGIPVPGSGAQSNGERHDRQNKK